VIRVFKSRIIQDLLTNEEMLALSKDFKGYKATRIIPEYFGRDVAYDHPNTLPLIQIEKVQHIHLGSEDKPLNLKTLQFHRTSDIHLVYCQGALNDDCYLLMTILSPDAHEQAKSRNIMHNLGKMAELFRNKF
jgi:mRNA interferase YafO